MPGDSEIKLRPLRIGQRECVRFQTLPDGIQQFRLLGRRQATDLASQIVHTPITLARFFRGGKRSMALDGANEIHRSFASLRMTNLSDGLPAKALHHHSNPLPSADACRR